MAIFRAFVTSTAMILAAWGQTPAAVPGAEAPRYVINAGDGIEFKFSYNPDMNERVTVRPDGYVSLAMVGDIRAAGKTPDQLGKDVSARYTGILKRPEVVAIMRDFAAQRVFVTGEVNLPGVLPLIGPLTLAQAVANAGGPKSTARLDQALLLRYEGSNRATVQKIDLREVLRGMGNDVPLGPFDVVFIPRSKIARVGLFVEQYVNSIIPRALLFPYNVNNVLSVRQ